MTLISTSASSPSYAGWPIRNELLSDVQQALIMTIRMEVTFPLMLLRGITSD